jgi:hypothetical protein
VLLAALVPKLPLGNAHFLRSSRFATSYVYPVGELKALSLISLIPPRNPESKQILTLEEAHFPIEHF